MCIMGFQADIRFQIVELCIIVITILDYFRKKKILFSSTKWFMVMVFSTFIYLISDIARIYTMYFYTGNPVNLYVHRFYYVLVLFCAFSFSVYIELFGKMIIEISKKYLLQLIIWLSPFVICVIGILSYGLDFHMSDDGAYASGVVSIFTYVGVGYYLLYIYVQTVRYKRSMTKNSIRALRTMMFVWIAAVVARMFNPYLMTSGIAITLSCVMLYYSIENQGAYIDDNTDAYNRKAFSMFFDEECNYIGKRDFFLATLVIDDMDMLISSIGRDNYELLMNEVVKRLSMNSSKNVFRIFDNIFATKIPLKADKMKAYADYVKQQMKESFVLPTSIIDVNSHMLVIECPTKADDPSDVLEIVRYDVHDNADFVRIVSDETIEKMHRSEKLLAILKNAIEEDGFEVAYQPIFSVKEQKFVSAEALVRLKDRDTIGFVSPEEFIPIAEQNGYIIGLGEAVFKKTCDTISEIRNLGIRLDYIEVNVSTLQIIDENVLRSFLNILNERNIEAKAMNFEITETAAVMSKRLMQKNVRALKAAGCTFSMDDYGTGYSNLSSMADTQFDIVKLDKSLIWPCFKDDKQSEKTRILLKNTITMLKELGFSIVAEGVETKEMVKLLSEYGVDYLQGYYYSKPIFKNEYIEYIKEHATA